MIDTCNSLSFNPNWKTLSGVSISVYYNLKCLSISNCPFYVLSEFKLSAFYFVYFLKNIIYMQVKVSWNCLRHIFKLCSLSLLVS